MDEKRSDILLGGAIILDEVMEAAELDELTFSDGALREGILFDELYRRTGRIRYKAGELFTDLSWFYIFDGIGMLPESYDPLIDVVTVEQLQEILKSIAQANAAAANGVPSHDSYFAIGTKPR